MRVQIITFLVPLLLSTATLVDAQNAEALRQQGLVQLDRGDIQGAIQIFNRILNQYSYDRKLVAQTILQLGDSFQSLNQPTRARAYYDQIMSQYSDQAEVVASARRRVAAAAAIGDVPKGWFMIGSKAADYETGVDNGTRYGGVPSVYLRSKEPRIDGFGTLMQRFTADQFLGRRVRFSAFVKSESVQQWAGLWMRVDGAGRRGTLAFDNMQDRPIKGTTGWSSYEVVLDVPLEAISINFGILLNGTGNVWINGVKFEEVGVIPTTENRDEVTPKGPTNLNFDDVTVSTGVPKGWFMAGSTPADYETRVDNGTMYAGLPSVYVRSKHARINGFGTLMQSFTAKQFLGRRVRFSAFVKSESVQQWAGLWMRVDGAGRGGTLAFDNMQDRPIKGTTGWSSYEVVLDVPLEAISINFGILLGGTGNVRINGVKFEEVGVNIPTTENRDKPKGPTNLNFDK